MQKENIIISSTVAFFSSIFGEFWFLFAFMILLNILDCITGTLKARYLKTESSKQAFKGGVKTLCGWIVICIAFGLSYSIIQLGEHYGKNLSFMSIIGWFTLAHSIINEIRSILENIVQMDKGHLVPKWLIRGLEVTQKKLNKEEDKLLDKFLNDEKEKSDKNYENDNSK